MALFMEALFPYLLAYLILTSWLLKLTSTYNGSTSFYYLKIYLLSALGGFPTGAAIIAQLKQSGELHSKDAARLLGICHSPSPLFVLGFVGQDLLGDVSIAWRYLLLLYAFSLILLLFIILKSTPHTIKQPLKLTANPFTTSIKESVPTVLIVGSTIIFFTTIYTVIDHLISSYLPSYAQILMAAVLEMTNGLHLAHISLDGNLLILATVLFLTTQSLSIHLQVVVIAKGAHLSLKPYMLVRLIFIFCIPTLYYLLFLL
ncbi:hypothetical protein [Lysinibacillus sp. 54212]|uniref:hypothetical protein n=1 Tax=Lysinibacillus sp. 54212 TaxID=3119829 RepID=UPI002FC95405